ncbi:hypothetical protein CBL_11912 [Carabus blaptoides fortunei]
MKIILLLFAALSTICAVTDNNSPYKIKVDRIDFYPYSTEYFDWSFTLFKLNRTITALNGTMNIVKKLPADTYVHYRVYEFRNNEYRRFPIDVKRKICDFCKNEYSLFVISELAKFPGSNPMPAECPLTPGNYWFYNYVPDAVSYPLLPAKIIKADFQYIIHNKPQLKLLVYLILDRDAIYRERFG